MPDGEAGQEAEEEEDCTDDPQLEVPETSEFGSDERVDPSNQASLRQTIRQSIKPRGRGAAAGKRAGSPKPKPKPRGRPKAKAKAKAKASPKKKPSPKTRASSKPKKDDDVDKVNKSRRASSAKSSKSASPKSKASPKARAKTPAAAPKKKSIAKPKAKAKGKPAKKRVPPRGPDGKRLALGCSSCRFTKSGCDNCERPEFRGKRRSDVSAEVIRKAQQSLSSYKKRKEEEQMKDLEGNEEGWEEGEEEEDPEGDDCEEEWRSPKVKVGSLIQALIVHTAPCCSGTGPSGMLGGPTEPQEWPESAFERTRSDEI